VSKVTYKEVREVESLLNSLSYEERIIKLDLNTDRADVIVPASRILANVLKWSDCRKLYVPKIGLADGIIHQLYKQHKGEDTALDFIFGRN
jgi:exopolyphosphatase/guanosine-5'-triphosphate,3'-diphosphate pyrophosphatase